MLIVGIENPQGEIPLSGLRVSVGLRQDQPRDADSAGELPRLEGVDRRRGHRLAASGPGRPAVRDQSGVRLLRRRARHQREDQPQRLRNHPPRHDLHQRRAHRGQPALVGGAHRGQARDRLAGTPLRSGERARRAPEFPLHRRRHGKTRPIRSSPMRRAACRSRAIVFGGRRRSLAPLVYQARNWPHGVLVGAGSGLGDDGGGHRRGRRRAPRSDGDEALRRLQLRRLLGALDRRRREAQVAAARYSTSTGSARTRPASSCGRASATTCACCAGSSSAARARREAHETADRPAAARRRSRHRRASTCRAAALEELLAVVTGRVARRTRGDRRLLRRSSATGCRRRCNERARARRCGRGSAAARAESAKRPATPRRCSGSPARNCCPAPCRVRSGPRRESASSRGARRPPRRPCRGRRCRWCSDR